MDLTEIEASLETIQGEWDAESESRKSTIEADRLGFGSPIIHRERVERTVWIEV